MISIAICHSFLSRPIQKCPIVSLVEVCNFLQLRVRTVHLVGLVTSLVNHPHITEWSTVNRAVMCTWRFTLNPFQNYDTRALLIR